MLRRQGLEQREDGADGLANASGRLGHQAPARSHRFVDRLGQVALPGTEVDMGKRQALRASVACRTVLHLLPGPVQEQRALLIEELLKVGCIEPLVQHGFAFADDVEVHQRQVDMIEPEFLAHQPAIHLDLGPVQLPMVGGLGSEVATVGFDFFQAVGVRVVAVRPAPHLELLVIALQGDLVLIVRAAPGCHRAMADDAFLGAGRRRKAQVEVADLGRELTQRPHGHAVTQAGCSAQRT